jgi:hypothetical protein
VTKAEYSHLVKISVDADTAWQRELDRVYGKLACAARYDERGTATAELQYLFEAKVRSNAVRHNALMDIFVAGDILA